MTPHSDSPERTRRKSSPPSVSPASSVPALALTHAAYEKAATVGESVAMELRDCLFERGLDISKPDVLWGIARAHDLDTILEAIG